MGGWWVGGQEASPLFYTLLSGLTQQPHILEWILGEIAWCPRLPGIGRFARSFGPRAIAFKRDAPGPKRGASHPRVVPKGPQRGSKGPLNGSKGILWEGPRPPPGTSWRSFGLLVGIPNVPLKDPWLPPGIPWGNPWDPYGGTQGSLQPTSNPV